MQLNLNELARRDDPSYYVLAGAITLVSLLERFVNETGSKFLDLASCQQFFSLKCNKFLHSYGLNLGPKTKLDSNFNKKVLGSLKLLKDNLMFKKTELFLDSGGFQVSIGKVSKSQALQMIDSYHNFLSDFHQSFDFAFSLDLVPGPNCVAFSTFKDVLETNLQSYKLASQLDPDSRKKVVYIHHFRTPRLLSIFREILFEFDMFSKFDNFATGGIVANLASDTAVNVVLYIIPLIDLLHITKQSGRRDLNFHILGGATYRDIFFYELVKLHVKRVHDINLKITFDSSSIFKGLMVARHIHVLEDDRVLTMSLKERELGQRWVNGKSIRERLQEIMDHFMERNDFNHVDFTNPYDPETGTFRKECSMYLMLYVLDFFFEIQKYLREKAEEIYKKFEEDDLPTFNSEVEKVIRSLNRGKATRKQRSKSYSIWRSLQALTDLDIDYANHLVHKFLSKDEFTNLLGNQELLTF